MRSASSGERSSAGPSDQSARRRRFLLNREIVRSSAAAALMFMLSGEEEEEGRESSPAGEAEEEEEALARSCLVLVFFIFFFLVGKKETSWRSGSKMVFLVVDKRNDDIESEARERGKPEPTLFSNEALGASVSIIHSLQTSKSKDTSAKRAQNKPGRDGLLSPYDVEFFSAMMPTQRQGEGFASTPRLSPLSGARAPRGIAQE